MESREEEQEEDISRSPPGASEAPTPACRSPPGASETPTPACRSPPGASETPTPACRSPPGASETPTPACRSPPGASEAPTPACRSPPGASETPTPACRSPPGASETPTPACRSPPGASETPTPASARPAPPSSLALTGSRPRKKKLVAPALSLTLGRSDSAVSDDYATAAVSPSPVEDDDLSLDDDPALDIDLDALETPSDSESLHFPVHDLDLEDDLRRLGVASHHRRGRHRGGSEPEPEPAGVGSLEQDLVDSQGIRWRRFRTGEPPQESLVNMSILEPYLRVLSHGGYYGDGTNDIIVFSSCYLPDNTVEDYQNVMDHLFRYVVGTLDLMVAENYVIVYLCAMAQRSKLPSIGWLRECYTTIDRRLRKNLKGLYVVHPTWYIKALITIIKPFISSKFSRKLQFVDNLQDLSQHIPSERVQIPDCVKQFDESLDR